MEQLSFRLAVSATFTAEPIEPVLAFWGRHLKTSFDVRFAAYNQLVQTLISPVSEFASNQHGVNILLARLEDLAQFDADDPATLARLESNFHHLIEAIRAAPPRLSVPLIFVLCPPSPAFLANPARARFAHEITMLADATLDETPGLQFLSHAEIQRLYPVLEPANPEGERLGGIPYSDLYFAALGTALIRLTHRLLQQPFKVIALDCDYTLWRGICGEDGPQGVVVDPPRRALQEFMCDQHEAGMLLAMTSKNNESDVFDTFEQNPVMPLQLRHFIAWRLNWDSKGANLTSLARELSLGLDSIIFVDDNPKECAEAEESVPEVLALGLPEDATAIPHFLNHIWAFDHPIITAEDRHRNAYYSQAQAFGRELNSAASLDHFLETLELRIHFDPPVPERLGRIAQLTQRTNQFNFTARRRTEAEIQALLADGSLECLTVGVADRFGDYGLTGVVLFRTTTDSLEIDTVLLSCRVLGRGVEHRVMARLGEEAVRRGLKNVVTSLHVTQRNQPAREFLHSIGAGVEQSNGSALLYYFDAATLSSTNAPRCAAAPPPAHAFPTEPRASASGPRKRPDYARIANTLSSPAQILEAMRHEARATWLDPTLTETEARLARIWSDLL